MAQQSSFGPNCFQYQPLDTADSFEIRLLTILPLRKGEPRTAPVRCVLDHLSISPSQLAPREPEESLTSRFPSIYFSDHVIKRPPEWLETPCPRLLALNKARGLREKCKGMLGISRESSSLLNLYITASVDELRKLRREVRVEAFSSLGRHPEEIGGGFTMSWPLQDGDDEGSEDHGIGSVAKGLDRKSVV